MKKEDLKDNLKMDGEKGLEDIVIERKISIKKIKKPQKKLKLLKPQKIYFKKELPKEKNKIKNHELELPSIPKVILKNLQIEEFKKQKERELAKKRQQIETAHIKPIAMLERPISKVQFPEVIIPAQAKPDELIKHRHKLNQLHKKILKAHKKSQELLLKLQRRHGKKTHKKQKHPKNKKAFFKKSKPEFFRNVIEEPIETPAVAKPPAKNKFESEIERIRERISKLE